MRSVIVPDFAAVGTRPGGVCTRNKSVHSEENSTESFYCWTYFYWRVSVAMVVPSRGVVGPMVAMEQAASANGREEP